MLICLTLAIKSWWPDNSGWVRNGEKGLLNYENIEVYVSLHTSPFPYRSACRLQQGTHESECCEMISKEKDAHFPATHTPNYSPYCNLFCRTKQGEGFQGLWKMPCQWGGLFSWIVKKNGYSNTRWSQWRCSQPIRAGCYLFVYVSV